MVFEIKEIAKEIIELAGHKFTQKEIDKVLIIQVPSHVTYTEKVDLANKIKEAIPTKDIIIVDDSIKFCKLDKEIK